MSENCYLFKCKNCGQLFITYEWFSLKKVYDKLQNDGYCEVYVGLNEGSRGKSDESDRAERVHRVFPFAGFGKRIDDRTMKYDLDSLDGLIDYKGQLEHDSISLGNEAYISSRLPSCPICGETNLYMRNQYDKNNRWENNTWYVGILNEKNINENLQKLKEVSEKSKEEDKLSITPKQAQLIQKCKESVDSSVFIDTTGKVIKPDQYLKQLISILTTIYSLETRLGELLVQQINADQYLINNECKIKKDSLDDLKLKLKIIESEMCKIQNDTPFILSADWDVKNKISKPLEPAKPSDFTLSQPQEPEYRKSGLFNRKAILEENEKLKLQYDTDMQVYRDQRKEYEESMTLWRKALNEYEKQRQIYTDKKKNIEQDERIKWKANLYLKNEKYKELTDKEKEYQEILKNPSQYQEQLLSLSPARVLNEINRKEIEECVETLKKAYQTKHDYLSSGILFSKYATLPAITTIYEYFVSGRCSEFAGPNGAYNLYESEIRTNQIIDKLDVITEKLDQIEASQYSLYQVMQSVNSQLRVLNSETLNATNELRNMGGSLMKISNEITDISNNSAIIAYNTAVTAYYSKRNAELTNSLGYLLALK